MPLVTFDALSDEARVWVFGASAAVDGAARATLLDSVDAHLSQWRAHGAPLVCARAFRDDRFLAIGVDEAATGATGCSIDGMFRVLTSLEPQIGTSLVVGGTVFWRDGAGHVVMSDRPGFRAAVAQGAVTAETPVFDTTVSTASDWRQRFERPASESWHGKLITSATR